MTPVVVLIAALGVLSAPVPPGTGKEGTDLAALEKKLHGTWAGQGPCDGGFTFRADGTYDRTLHGPGGNSSAGTWAVRWDALPPTLVLTCKTSDDPLCGRTTEVRLVRLDDQDLAFTDPDGPRPAKPTRYARVKK